MDMPFPVAVMPVPATRPPLINAVRRISVAAFMYLLLMWIILSVHDYPQFREALRNPGESSWRGAFYFINEAGSGIKFLFTGNEKYMGYFPSPSHLLAARTAKAMNGDWEMQMLVGRMYYFGEFAPQDKALGLQWFIAAGEAAPPDQRAAIAALIKKIKEEPGYSNTGSSLNKRPDEPSPSVSR